MRRTKTLLMGDLLDEFFRRPYVAAKVAELRESGLTVSAQCAIPERVRYAELRRMKD